MSKIHYIKFLWNSVNAHGVHSPFVFNIATEALNVGKMRLPKSKSKEIKPVLNPKAIDILLRVLQYFKPEKSIILGNEALTAAETVRTCGEHLNIKIWFLSHLAHISGTIDMVYLSATEEENPLPLFEKLLPNIGNKTMCVVTYIHSSPETQEVWETIKEDPRITVTIDTYHLGLVFFRQGQAKEHFIIRTTNSKFLDFVLGARKLWGLLY